MDTFIRHRFLPVIFSTRARDVKQHQQVALRRETKVKRPRYIYWVQYLVSSMGALAYNSSSEEGPRIDSFSAMRMSAENWPACCNKEAKKKKKKKEDI